MAVLEAASPPVVSLPGDQSVLQAEIERCSVFWDRYCDLAELIADAAHDGVETWMPDAYENCRMRFAEVFVGSPFEPSHDFESLFMPTSLPALLLGDQGQLQEQLTRSREALEHWADSLAERLRLAGLLA